MQYQGQILVAAPVGDFIDANCLDRIEGAVFQSPLHHVLDRLIDLLPTGAKAHCGLLPGQFARPVRQIEHVGMREGMFADAPGHLLNRDAASAALHPAQAVEQHHGEAPDRNELKARRGSLA